MALTGVWNDFFSLNFEIIKATLASRATPTLTKSLESKRNQYNALEIKLHYYVIWMWLNPFAKTALNCPSVVVVDVHGRSGPRRCV